MPRIINLPAAIKNLAYERACMVECVKNKTEYSTETSIIPCVNRGWWECDCPPGGGCSPYYPGMSEEEHRIALEEVAKEREKMNRERLEELCLALVEENPEAALPGYDPLHILEQEYQNLLRISHGQAPFRLRRPASATPPWRKEYADGGADGGSGGGGGGGS